MTLDAGLLKLVDNASAIIPDELFRSYESKRWPANFVNNLGGWVNL